MTRSKPKIQKKLEKVVLATLMFAGAVQLAMNPSLVEAFTITVEDANDPLSVTGMATSGYYYSPNSAECTELKITGGTASYLYAGFQDYFSNGADVSGHTITVDGATVGAVVGGLGFSSANVENNTVNIVSGTVNSAYGGLISSPGVSTAYVNNNTVNVSGGTVTSTVYGGRSEADANYNTVNISGGTVNQYIYGGQSTYGTTASNNTVTIKGDAVLGPSAVIYGGHATKYGGSSVTYGTASDNTVNILTPIKIMGLYGGLGDTSKSTGNTLNIAAVGVKVESSSGSAVKYFQNINFFLPKGSAGQTMLTIENGNGNDLDGVTIGAAVLEGSDLKKDDTVTLIKKDTGVGNVTLSNTTNGNVTFLAANNLKTDTEYELSLSKTDTAIEAKVEKGVLNVHLPKKEVTVKKESDSPQVNLAERRADYWNFGGIWRPVFIVAKPVQNIQRVAIDARADGRFMADVFLSRALPKGSVSVDIIDANGKKAATTTTDHRGGDQLHVDFAVKSPRLWNAETPNLYTAVFTLKDAQGLTLHIERHRFGFRTIEYRHSYKNTGLQKDDNSRHVYGCNEDGLFVNGQKVIIKGVNRHSFRPETGRTLSKSKNIEDVELIKSMNMNAVRLSHYPADPEFLDACYSLGL